MRAMLRKQDRNARLSVVGIARHTLPIALRADEEVRPNRLRGNCRRPTLSARNHKYGLVRLPTCYEVEIEWRVSVL